MVSHKTLTVSEKQLISTLSWFRSRYALFIGQALDRKANRDQIEEFGRIWMGDYKENWDAPFSSLTEKGIIKNTDGEYEFTEYGALVKIEVETETPFFKYEYDNYFTLDQVSAVHSTFCERVYGIDFSQHGLIDHNELSVLISKLKDFSPRSVLDIGCGNGRITEWICAQTKADCVGIDISSEAVRYANGRVPGNSKLRFLEGNLNNIPGIAQYDCILFLDTLYYAANLLDTLKQALATLAPDGRIYAYFSQWIMDVDYKENLLPRNTHLAKALDELKVKYEFTDLTISGLNHWRKKFEVLGMMKEDFVAEGSIRLWEYRYREANRYAHWGDDKYSRFLYEIRRA